MTSPACGLKAVNSELFCRSVIVNISLNLMNLLPMLKVNMQLLRLWNQIQGTPLTFLPTLTSLKHQTNWLLVLYKLI